MDDDGVRGEGVREAGGARRTVYEIVCWHREYEIDQTKLFLTVRRTSYIRNSAGLADSVSKILTYMVVGDGETSSVANM